MSGLLNPNPDPEMVAFLEAHGWETLWHPDNWIKTEWRSNPRMNLDMAGTRTENAYEQALAETAKR